MSLNNSIDIPLAEIRKAHYLRPSGNAGYPKHHIVLHVEPRIGQSTDGGHTRPITLAWWRASQWTGEPGCEKIGSCGNGTDPDSFWAWLKHQLAPKRCTWLWQFRAVQGCSLLGLWEKLSVGLWTLDGNDPLAPGQTLPEKRQTGQGLCIIEDPPTIILARPSTYPGSVKWLDIRNLGLDDYAQCQCDSGDVTALGSFLVQWIQCVDELGLGGLRHTAPAQAWHGFRHSYLNTGILIHDNDTAVKLERSAIHPGRAEAYQLGRIIGPVYHFDAAAHYPACSIDGPQPIKLAWTGMGTIADMESATRLGYLTIARCRIATGIPALPCRSGHETIYPTGTFTTCLAGPEISLAVSIGVLLGVSQLSLYETGDPWQQFMRRLWRERIGNGNAQSIGKRACVKRLMNSVIGKAAARGWKWLDDHNGCPPSDWCRWTEPDAETGMPMRWRSLGWHTQREVFTGEHPESCPQLAAWVYSLGRVRMWNWLEMAGRENVYYVDTDSVYCSAVGAHKLQANVDDNAGRIGALQLRGVYDWLQVDGIKQYQTPASCTIAGKPSDAFPLSGGGFGYWRSRTIKDSLGDNCKPNAPTAEQRRFVVSSRRQYRHGVVADNGSVTPIHLER